MVELMPGEVADGVAGDQFKTLLGSCVSVILTDPRRTAAAICHIVHTSTPNAANSRNTAYGLVAIEDMRQRLQRRGLIAERCEAYVYGGGNMFPQFFSERNVGIKNANWVMDVLEHEGIQVVAHQLGGNGYRKVAWTIGPLEPLVETVFPEPGKAI